MIRESYWITIYNIKLRCGAGHEPTIRERPVLFGVKLVDNEDVCKEAIKKGNIRVIVEDKFTSIFALNLDKDTLDRVWVQFPNMQNKDVIVDVINPFKGKKFFEAHFEDVYNLVE